MAAPTPELVNPVPVEAVEGWTRAMMLTFLDDPDGPATARRVELLTRGWEPGRAWGARDRNRWVATLRTEERRLSVSGRGESTGELRADALTNVTVAATHRRQGLMRRMLEESLRAARDRGDPISILIAAEWPIYGRFGYAAATVSADYVLRRSRPGAECPGDPNRLRQVERDEFGALAPAVFAAARRRRAGQLDREPDWWDRVLGRGGYQPSGLLPHHWLIRDGEAGPDGLLAWKANGDFGLVPPLAAVEVWDLTAATAAAYRDIWSYLSGIDGIESVRLDNRPVDEPVRWLLRDARTLVTTSRVDFLWLRLLDIPTALAARRYAVPGEIVLRVLDGDGLASGRYRLSADGGDVACTTTAAAPDVEITQEALASIYLGGFRLRELHLARTAGVAVERTPGTLGLLDLMFSTALAPWNATWF